MNEENQGVTRSSAGRSAAPTGLSRQGPSQAKPAATNAAHTPGPWRISVDPKGFLCIRTGERNEHPDSDLVAEVYCGGANAHLIAAAPELYDLVFESLYHLRNDARAEAYHKRALAALGKARGE